MSLPLIGVTGNHRQDDAEKDHFQLSYVPDGYMDGVAKASALPVLLPISDPSLAKDYVSKIDGLILSGGQDVSPFLFNEEPHLKLGRVHPARDAFEMALIREAFAQRKPILAICRGMQILNVAFGGNLYQDIPSQYPNALQHAQVSAPTTAIHSITLEEASFLGSLLGSNVGVNSYHHQAVKDLAPNFKPVAWSADGLLEAFEGTDPDHLVVATQWHPEQMLPQHDNMQTIFNAFVAKIKG